MERFTLSSLDGIDLAALDPAAAPLARPRFNIARDQDALVAVERAGARAVVAMRWGMLSPWRGHGGVRPPNVYEVARDAIAAAALPPFLRAAVRTQRCLVLADGWFAWRRTRKPPQPHWIHRARSVAASAPAAFAGIWTVHRDDDRPSVAIVVAPAGPDVAPFASAAPVLASDAWLGPLDAAVAALAAPCDPWRVDAVSTWVNDEAHDDPRCIASLGNPAQGELF